MTTLWEIAETVRAEESATQQEANRKVSLANDAAGDRLNSSSTTPLCAKEDLQPPAIVAPGLRPRISSWSLSLLREPYTPGLP